MRAPTLLAIYQGSNRVVGGTAIGVVLALSVGLAAGCATEDGWVEADGVDGGSGIGLSTSVVEPVVVTGRGDSEAVASYWMGMYKWPSGLVPFHIDVSTVPSTEDAEEWAENIREGIQTWNRESRLVFVERTTESNWVRYVWDESESMSYGGCTGCSALIPDGAHDVKIRAGASVFTTIHETGHRIGLLHEHQREDRDEHIWLFWDEVKYFNEFLGVRDENMMKLSTIREYILAYGTLFFSPGFAVWLATYAYSPEKTVGEYDAESAMHYESDAKSIGGFATMLRKDAWSLYREFVTGAPVTCRQSSGSNFPKLGETRVGDFDGDGDDDLLFMEGEEFWVAYSTPGHVNGDCGGVRLLGAALPGVSI